VYSDWIDACDAVAKDAAAADEVDDGLNSYEELTADNEGHNLETSMDRHLHSKAGSGHYGQEGSINDD